MHRPQQRRLVGSGGIELGGHAPAVETDDAVADERDLGQLAREQEHGGAVGREPAQQRVDLAFRADVDAAGRVEAEQRLEAVREPAGDRHLLLVAAREPAHLALRARVHRERLDRARTRRRSSRMPTGPQRAGLLKRGAAMFSAIERCGSSACSRSAGTSTTPARIASYGCRARSGLPRTSTSPPVGRCWPESTSKSSSWPWASSAAMPRISPGRTRERDVGERLAHLQPAYLERGRPVGGDLDPLARRRRLGLAGGTRDLLAEHDLDDLLLAALPRHQRADVAAVAEHSRAVAVGDHLTQAMGDEERGATALLLPRASRRRRVRRDRTGSAAVISSRIRSCGSRASARARSSMRSSGSGTSSACSREVDRRGRARAAAAAPPRPACP